MQIKICGMVLGNNHEVRGIVSWTWQEKYPVWSVKEIHWSIGGLIVKSAEFCSVDYQPRKSSLYILIQIAMKLVLRGVVKENSSYVQMMAMQLTDTYMDHLASLC